jgi:hypothetical protein
MNSKPIVLCTITMAFVLWATPQRTDALIPGSYACHVDPPYQQNYYTANSNGEAIGICQSWVNYYAVSICASLVNSSPWQMTYMTAWSPSEWTVPDDAVVIHSDDVWWQCINGGAYYA